MTPFLPAIRLLLPVLFFGYGISANLYALATAPGHALPQKELLSGGLTRDFERLYKRDLPHFALSFGLIGAARYAVLGEARSGAVTGQDGWLFTAEETRALPTGAQMDQALRQIAAIRTRLAANGTTLVLLPLPAKIDVASRHAPDPAFGSHLAHLHADLLDRLDRAGIAAVDVRPALLAAAAPVFFQTDTHWTPEGAATVAQAVAGSGRIAKGDLSFTVQSRVEMPLTGDLVSYVTEPDLAPLIGLPPEKVRLQKLEARAASDDIFGDAAADVVLIGTSYSANSNWGFADALMQALGRDVVNMAQQGLGPVTPMQSYLDSADFRDAPPAVVVWEFPVRYLTDPELWPVAVADPAIAALPREDLPNG